MSIDLPSASASSSSRAFPLPSISEDTLHYTLHLPSSSDATSLAVLITQYVESLLPNPWLWNKDSFELKVASAGDHIPNKRVEEVGSGENTLEGIMRVGDAVDDEWLVVWLLREVSRKWPDIVISVRDTDGEFLLIEAANELPSWVSPENAENRLWLCNAHLHLIPLSVRSSTSGVPRAIPDDESLERQYDPDAFLTPEDAVKAVRTGKYCADANIEGAVWRRISGYPEALKTHLHRSKAYLPLPIAKALKVAPDLVQKAVEGFYVRDPAQLRAASRMTHFPPSPAVLTSVLTTRAAYAQLQGQAFHPPRVFGPEWSVRDGADLDSERRWRDLGVKIATGFEIMYREGGRKGRSGHAEADGEIPDDDEYKRYIANLKSAGFFGQESEGSEKWKIREKEALRGWKSARAADVTAQRPSFAFQVDNAIASASAISAGDLAASENVTEDSESWLEVSPDELDSMMMRASGQAGPSSTQVEEKGERGPELSDLAKKVEEFVGGQGDLEGARFADELSDEDMDDDDDEEDETIAADEWEKLSPEEKAERMSKLVPALPDSEWGRKTQEPPVTTEPPNPTRDKPIQPVDARPVMRPPIFAKQEYDGVVSDSDDSEDEADLPAPGTLGRKIAQMRWADTAPRIEEIDDEEEEQSQRSKRFGLGDDIDEAMHQRVWGEDDAPTVVEGEGEMDVDMGDEEEEFLKFSREALGISDEQWEGILSSRRDRGAFVPTSKPTANRDDIASALDGSEAAKRSNGRPPKRESATTKATEAQPTPEQGGKNMELDSFEKVMRAMDAELAKVKKDQAPAPQPTTNDKAKSKSKSKVSFADPLPSLPTEQDLEDMTEDDLRAMDRELRAALKGAGVDDDDLDGELDVEEAQALQGDDRREYAMMRDFLESVRSQGGQSGVVGNLFGRLGETKK
ncbi:SGT1 protein-domain-containing protein [Naematelia encephala]|uniref:SGT1 protein-domain-containing protein n=1 Tax=Naematelia encephala TaxID=71784 RepID=A0A1Y2BJI6_9TREE|nr:SGT1 protein-domain-containing protein [Naematelia encephala]